MDMLQVGRGMSYEEYKTHFSMWGMLNSPLLTGNDLRSMNKQTIEIFPSNSMGLKTRQGQTAFHLLQKDG
jgi:hypothetical protein